MERSSTLTISLCTGEWGACEEALEIRGKLRCNGAFHDPVDTYAIREAVINQCPGKHWPPPEAILNLQLPVWVWAYTRSLLMAFIADDHESGTHDPASYLQRAADRLGDALDGHPVPRDLLVLDEWITITLSPEEIAAIVFRLEQVRQEIEEGRHPTDFVDVGAGIEFDFGLIEVFQGLLERPGVSNTTPVRIWYTPFAWRYVAESLRHPGATPTESSAADRIVRSLDTTTPTTLDEAIHGAQPT